MEFIEVDSVESLDYEGKVHDIEVEVDHCYTANGYSVHNSAAGSLVNYLIGITDVDPIQHDLMFERFLDIARADVVDIDMDYEPRVRDAVIDHVIEKYGSKQVSAIGTFGTTKTKVAVADAARVLGVPINDTFHITKNVLGADVDDDAPWETLIAENQELQDYLEKHKNLTRNGHDLSFFIKGIRNAPRSISQHAAGVLITSDDLMRNIPLIRASKRIVTGWQEGSDFRELSDLGYFKFDVLGLNNLQVINDAVTLVEQRRGVKIDLNSLDLEDKLVYDDIINKHDHFGVFQFECVAGDTLVDGKTIKERFEAGILEPLRSVNEETNMPIRNECLAIAKSGVKQLFEITLADGKKMKCSNEHKFKTRRGWVALKDLTEKDEILVEE